MNDTPSAHLVAECTLHPTLPERVDTAFLQYLAATVVERAATANLEATVVVNRAGDDGASAFSVVVTMSPSRAVQSWTAFRLTNAFGDIISRSLNMAHWNVDRMNVVPLEQYLRERAQLREQSLESEWVPESELPTFLGVPSRQVALVQVAIGFPEAMYPRAALDRFREQWLASRQATRAEDVGR